MGEYQDLYARCRLRRSCLRAGGHFGLQSQRVDRGRVHDGPWYASVSSQREASPALALDIAGKLYHEFDMLSRTTSVPGAIKQWASSLGITAKGAPVQQTQPHFVVLPPGVGPKSLKRLLRPLLDADVVPEVELREVSRLGSHSFARHMGYLRANRLVVQAEEGRKPVSLTDSGKACAQALFSRQTVPHPSGET